MVKVKICGVRDLIGARACAAIGVEYAGLNFVASSPRSVTLPQAMELASRLGSCEPVAVFRDEKPEVIENIAKELELKWLQLHGNETPEECKRFRGQGLSIMKALSVTGPIAPKDLKIWQGAVDILLLDGKFPGSGKPFDWSLLKKLPELKGIEIGLAGGLTSTNVAQAVRTAHPAVVDTASGVEIRGVQQKDRIKAFARAAREAE